MRIQRWPAKERHGIVMAVVAIILFSCIRLVAQQGTITRIVIQKKPRSADGHCGTGGATPLALSDAPLKSPSGYFRLGLSNLGLIQAAIDFCNTPPLNGGGTYQAALQYGAGFKYRVLPRLTIRADYGETWSANPDVIKHSYRGYLPTGLDNTYTTIVTEVTSPGKYVQQRSTLGFALTF
jgi:hypothetical protein